MAGTRTRRKQSPGRAAGGRAASGRSTATWPWVAGGVLVAVVAVGIALALVSGAGSAGTSDGTLVQGNGGTWTNISADTLATKLEHKDFTLLNVKTPYIGEIKGTDLYIPYSDLSARAAELPADKTAPIVVYCRSGSESAIASQTLLDLGYTNIENLDGGMNAWSASGRQIVQVARS